MLYKVIILRRNLVEGGYFENDDGFCRKYDVGNIVSLLFYVFIVRDFKQKDGLFWFYEE